MHDREPRGVNIGGGGFLGGFVGAARDDHSAGSRENRVGAGFENVGFLAGGSWSSGRGAGFDRVGTSWETATELTLWS